MFKRLKTLLLPVAILAATLGVAPNAAAFLSETRVGGYHFVDAASRQVETTQTPVSQQASAFRNYDTASECSVAAKSTGGRLGSTLTREHVADVATEMESRGWEITGGGGRLPEEYLPGPGGARTGSSFPDITATKNGRTLRVNTVDTYADGVTLTTREAANAARIRAQTGEHLLLIPKP